VAESASVSFAQPSRQNYSRQTPQRPETASRVPGGLGFLGSGRIVANSSQRWRAVFGFLRLTLARQFCFMVSGLRATLP
jgi:hypothetical protein